MTIVEARGFLSSLLDRSSLRGRFAYGTFWSLIASVISQVSSLAMSIVTARLLGKEAFGELGIVTTTISLFGTFAGMGLGMTATKYIAEFRLKDPDRGGRILTLSLASALVTSGAVAALLILSAPLLASYTLNAPSLTSQLQFAALYLFASTLAGAQTGALIGFEAYQSVAKVNLARAVISLPVTVAAAFWWGLSGAVWALGATFGAACLLNHLALLRECSRHKVHFDIRGSWAERRVLWRFSVPAFLSSAIVAPTNWGANALLVNRPHGFAEMGVFNAANQWRGALLLLPVLMGQVSMPILSSLDAKADLDRTRRVLAASLGLTLAVTVALALPLLLMSEHLMRVYGLGFAGRGAVLRMTVLTAALLSVQMPIGNLIAAAGRMWLGAIMNTTWAVTLLLSTWALLTKGHGADGLALANLIAYGIHSFWIFGYGIKATMPVTRIAPDSVTTSI